MKKLLIIAFMLFCSFGLFAEFEDSGETDNSTESANSAELDTPAVESESSNSEVSNPAESSNSSESSNTSESGNTSESSNTSEYSTPSEFGNPAESGHSTYIQPTLGIGLDAENDKNIFGLSAGVDIDWKVWEKPTSHAHDGSGKMYAGIDFAMQWWLPTQDGFNHHWIMIPVQGNFSYEFDTTKMQGSGPLVAVGPWISLGIGFNIYAWSEDVPVMDDNGLPKLDDDHKPVTETKSHGDFEPSFAYGIGATLAFNGGWILKVGIGGNKGLWDANSDSPWNKDFFTIEAAYRFDNLF